jgi:hypothetical protein
MAARLERRAEEAAELRVRLELTEQTQSTLEDDRRWALEELAEERRRREAAERERDELRRDLQAAQRPQESPETVAEMPMRPEPSEAREETQEAAQPRSWWRRVFGG